MTTRKVFELESLVFVIIGAMVGAFVINQMKSNPGQFHSYTNLPALAADPTSTLTPTPIFVPTVTTTSQTSSDGTKKVIVKVKQNKDNTKTYDVSTADGDDSNVHPIISKTLDSTKNIIIPFNAWSPNNKYFFIQENTQELPIVLVFRAAGEAFNDGAAYLDLTEGYKNQKTDDLYGEATGWASDNLIYINTLLEDGTQGPSYWFEVPSKNIIRLSTKF